jgi:hypothetical protein
LRVSSAPDASQTSTRPVVSSSKKVVSAHTTVGLQSDKSKDMNGTRMRHSTTATSVDGDLSMFDTSMILADGDLSMLDVEESLTPTEMSFIRSDSSAEFSLQDQSSIAHGTTPSRWSPTQPHIMESSSTQWTRPAMSRAISGDGSNSTNGSISLRRHQVAIVSEPSNSSIPSEPPAKKSPNLGRARLGMTRRVVATAVPTTSKSSATLASRHTLSSPADTRPGVEASTAKYQSHGVKTSYKSPCAQSTRAPPPVTRLPTPDDTPPDSGTQADSSFEYDAPSWDAEDWDILMQPHVSQ